jgi:proline dehydrogenase
VEVNQAEATAFAQSGSRNKEKPPHKRIVDEMIRCIDVAADFEDGIADKFRGGRRTWVAVKIVSFHHRKFDIKNKTTAYVYTDGIITEY